MTKTGKKISKKLTGRKLSQTHKENIGNVAKKRHSEGDIFGFQKGINHKREKNPNYIDGRSRMLNLTLEQQEKIAGRKKPKQCEICGAIDCRICFDHNHENGEFRGWICHRCNVVLGFVKDSPDLLNALIKYLKK